MLCLVWHLDPNRRRVAGNAYINNSKGSVTHEKDFMGVFLYETLPSRREDSEVWLGSSDENAKVQWERGSYTQESQGFLSPSPNSGLLMGDTIRETSVSVTG